MAMTGMGGSTTVVVVSIGGSVPSPGVAAPGARVVAVPGSAATVAGTLPTGSDVAAPWVATVDCVATAAWPARRLSSMSFVFGFALTTAPVSSSTERHAERADQEQAAALAGPLGSRAGPPARHPATDGAAADRGLDEAVGQVGQHEGDDQPDDEDGARAEADVHAGSGEGEDRPVPEVDAVGPHADVDEERDAEPAAEAHRRVGHGRDDGDGRHVHQEEAAAVEERSALGAEDAQEREPDRPEHAGRGHRSGLHRRDAGLQLPRVPEERQAAAEHQAADAGVRPVVDERRVGRVVQQRHQHGRGEREGQHGDEQPVRPLAEQHQEAGQGQRPQQVELLLDGQRPQVAQQRRPLELVEVGRAAQDEVPVHRVGEGGEEVALEAGQLLPDEQDADQGDGEQQCEHRGQQPAGPAEPEVLQPDGARCAGAR